MRTVAGGAHATSQKAKIVIWIWRLALMGGASVDIECDVTTVRRKQLSKHLGFDQKFSLDFSVSEIMINVILS